MKSTRIADILRIHATREQAAGSDTFASLLREAATRLEASEGLLEALVDLCAMDSNQAWTDEAGIKHWRDGIKKARAAIARANGLDAPGVQD